MKKVIKNLSRIIPKMLLILALSTLSSGCGQQGPLYLPDKNVSSKNV